MIYIQKQLGFWDIDSLPDSYLTGTTLEEYDNGAYLLLSDEQTAFHETNLDATQMEVWHMALTPIPEPEPTPEPDALAIARQEKLDEIVAQDKFGEKFFVSVVQYQRDENGVIKVDETGGKLVYEVANYTLWMDRSLRASMSGLTLPAFQKRGDTTRKFWTLDDPSQDVEVPIGWAINRIPRLEIYATETYDLFASNTSAAHAATTVEEIAQIDVKLNYPLFLTFELNIDLNNDGSNTTETIS